MRPLIVIAANDRIKDRLFQWFPDHVIFVADRQEAFDQHEQHPAAAIAYAPDAFAGAVAGKNSPNWPHVHTDHPQLLITNGLVQHAVDGLSPTEVVTDDPRQFVDQAALALRINLLLDVEFDAAPIALESFLAAPSPVSE